MESADTPVSYPRLLATSCSYLSKDATIEMKITKALITGIAALATLLVGAPAASTADTTDSAYLNGLAVHTAFLGFPLPGQSTKATTSVAPLTVGMRPQWTWQ